MSKETSNSFATLSKGIFILCAAVLGVSLPTSSFALGTGDQRAACTPDVLRLCSSQIPNVARIVSCMKAKKADLSAPCRAVFDKTPASHASRD